MSLLKLENLSKKFERPAVSDVNLTLEQGQILCLLGPSGCGKTTLLRLIAGLEQPDKGSVTFKGKDVTWTPPNERGFGMMFQEFALFPHKSVSENIAFGLQILKKSSSEINTRTMEMLELVGLTDLADSNVADISGGERQRVALARSLAPQPGLIMLDEPLGSLDRALRERLLFDIYTILKKLEMTTIFVTHDQTEALNISDMIAVMNQGHISQLAPPEELYRNPQSVFVARFLGFQNLVQGKAISSGETETSLGIFSIPHKNIKPQEEVTIVIRPEGARMILEKEASNVQYNLHGTVISRLFTGQSYQIKIRSENNLGLTFDLPNDNSPPLAGEVINLELNPASMSVIKS